MIAILSPAKTLDFSAADYPYATQPLLLEQSEQLVGKLRKKSAGSIQELMKVSEKIATLNRDRFRSFSTPFSDENAKPAILAFKGDVYLGLEAGTFNHQDLEFAQDHLRILSGLYGVLRPLDLMQPYRLEMGTPFKYGRKKDLYQFWDRRITDLVTSDLDKHEPRVIINLASKEYFKSIQPNDLNARVIQIDFKEKRNGQYKPITFNMKKARGRMAHLMIRERIIKAEDLQNLVVNDYAFNPGLSTEDHWLFTID